MNPYAMVLGVAQDGGHPQPGCGETCCRGPDVIPHLTTCVAVVDDGRAWLLDAGPDFPRHLTVLAEAELELAGVLLTHAHIGHYTGLMFLGREAMNASGLSVWAAPRLAAFLRNNGPWEQLINAGSVNLQTVGPADSVRLGESVAAGFFSVPHRDEYSETVGIRVVGPDANLLYVPDTDSWDDWADPVETYVSATDIALLDGTFFDTDELPTRDLAEIEHPFVAESMTRFGDLPDTERAKIHFTHLNHSNPLLRTGSDEYTRVVRAGMNVATEGAVFPL